MDQRTSLILLADTMAAHQGVTHFAISKRIFGKGDFFLGLKKRGRDCQTRTAARVMAYFDEAWPADLAWPAGIERPRRRERAA